MTFLVILFLPLFIVLGQWQLNRANEKEQLFKKFESLGKDTPVLLDGSDIDVNTFAHRQLQASGHYLNKYQFMRDNRTHNGIAGYHVITPLKIENTNKVVLVNRGWVPVGDSRLILPDIRVNENLRMVSGMAKQPDPRTMILGEEDPQGWPRVIQKIDFNEINKILGLEVIPVVIRLNAKHEDGFVRDWKAFYGIPPEKHRAYAIQWFCFAAMVPGLYIGLNLKRSRINNDD